MTNTRLTASGEGSHLEPFEDRIDIMFHELELATKWQRSSVLLAVYSSEYVREDADTALENRLHTMGQSAYRIRVHSEECVDITSQMSELANLENTIFFVDGLRWGASQDRCTIYHTLNKRREFFLENNIRVVFWLTEKEAVDLAHFAPDYWSFRHKVIEFVDAPKPDRITPHILESAWQGSEGITGKAGHPDKTTTTLQAALVDDLPDGVGSAAARANLLLNLGILQWRRADYERSTQLLKSALDLAAGLEDNGFKALCFNALALVQTDLGRFEEAIQAYQNALELAPAQTAPWNNLGKLYRKLERLPEALDAFKKAIEHNSSDALGWCGLGDVYQASGQNTDAITAYLKSIEYSPSYAHSWSGLGNSYLEEGQLDKALAAYQKAIEIDRGMVNSWIGLGHLYQKTGNGEYASLAFQTALELDPKNALAWKELGNHLFAAGELDQAMRSYQKDVEIDPDHLESFKNLTSIYIQKGMDAEAIPLLLKELEHTESEAEKADLLNRLGDMYRRIDDYDHAMEAYRKADALNKDSTLPQEVLPKAEAEGLTAGPGKHGSTPDGQIEPDPIPGEPALTSLSASPNSADLDRAADMEVTPPGDLTESDYVTWLDGMASVQSAISLAEAGEEFSGSSAFSNGIAAPEETEIPTNSDEEMTSLDGWANYQGGSTMGKHKDTSQAQMAIDEKNAQIWNELGNIYYNTGAFEEAMHAFEMAIELNPSYGWSYNNLASIFIHKKRYADAVPLYEKGLQLLKEKKDKAVLWNRLGDAYRRMNEHDLAVNAYRKAVELNPDNVSLLTRARFSLLGNLRV